MERRVAALRLLPAPISLCLWYRKVDLEDEKSPSHDFRRAVAMYPGA
jgi:hypothetical protein